MELNALPDGSRPTRRHSRSPILPSASVEREDFRDALDRKRDIRIAASCDVAVRIDHNQPEMTGVDPCEIRDVGGDVAAIRSLRHFLGDFSDDLG